MSKRTIKIINRAGILSHLQLFYPLQCTREPEEKRVKIPRKIKKTRIKRNTENLKWWL
jgi:hypothetical protein